MSQKHQAQNKNQFKHALREWNSIESIVTAKILAAIEKRMKEILETKRESIDH